MTDLSFGGGEFDVLVDLANRDISVYNGGEEFHARFGGRQYYTSRSGLSGSGWIPSRLDRIVVRGYRTETEIPWAALAPIGGGFELGIPTYRDHGGEIPEDYPALVRYPDRRLVVCHPDLIFAVLSGYDTYTPREYEFNYWPAAGQDPRTFRLTYSSYGEPSWFSYHRNNVHAVLRALNYEECFFQPDETPLSLPFWTRLGLHWQADGYAYKVALGVAWARYSTADLQTQAQRQAVSPANVLFLTERHYLQRSHDGAYEALGLDKYGRYYWASYLPPEAAMNIMMGSYEEKQQVIDALDRGIAAKAAGHAVSAQDLTIEALESAITANAGRALAVPVDFMAGFSESSIEIFRDEHFPHRESVTVEELAAHISHRGVERVLRHALCGEYLR